MKLRRPRYKEIGEIKSESLKKLGQRSQSFQNRNLLPSLAILPFIGFYLQLAFSTKKQPIILRFYMTQVLF